MGRLPRKDYTANYRSKQLMKGLCIYGPHKVKNNKTVCDECMIKLDVNNIRYRERKRNGKNHKDSK